MIPLSPRIAALSDASRERLAALPRPTAPRPVWHDDGPHPYVRGVQRTSAQLAAHEAHEINAAIARGIPVSWKGDGAPDWHSVASAEAIGPRIRYVFADGTSVVRERRHAGCEYALTFGVRAAGRELAEAEGK